MKRYAETLFRYWLIALAPIAVLALVGYAAVKGTPKTAQATAQLWVDPSAFNASANYNQYLAPADNEKDALTQLLQLSSFDWAVAHGSPLYMQLLSKQLSPGGYLGADLQKNVQFASGGNNLLYVSYSYNSKNWQLGLQVVQSVLNAALNQTQLLNQQQAASSISYYKLQFQIAQQNLKQSAQAFSRYRTAHGITTAELNAQMSVDPTLAGLYQQVQADQTSVANLRQKLATLQIQSTASAAPGQSGIRIADAPSVIIVSSKKKQLTSLAIYLVIGLLLSGGFVIVKTLMDRSLRYADEVPEALDLPVLAVLPYNPALIPLRSDAATPANKTKTGKRPARLRRIG